jgi:hypothetical protein
VLGWSVAVPGERTSGDGLVRLVAREGALEGAGGGAALRCGCGAAVGLLGADGEARVRSAEVRFIETPWSCPCCGHGAAADAAGAAATAPAAAVPGSAALRAMVEDAVSARLAGGARVALPGPDVMTNEEIDKIKYVLLALNERVTQLMAVLVPDVPEEPAQPGSKRARKDAGGKRALKDAAGAGPEPSQEVTAGGFDPIEPVLKSESGEQQPQGSPRRKRVVNFHPPAPSSPTSIGTLTAASVAAAATAAAAASAATVAPVEIQAAEPRSRARAARSQVPLQGSPQATAGEVKAAKRPARQPAHVATAGGPGVTIVSDHTSRV